MGWLWRTPSTGCRVNGPTASKSSTPMLFLVLCGSRRSLANRSDTSSYRRGSLTFIYSTKQLLCETWQLFNSLRKGPESLEPSSAENPAEAGRTGRWCWRLTSGLTCFQAQGRVQKGRSHIKLCCLWWVRVASIPMLHSHPAVSLQQSVPVPGACF